MKAHKELCEKTDMTKMKWDHLYKPNTDGKKHREVFDKFCAILEKYDGELLSDYIESRIDVRVRIFGIEESIAPYHFERFVDSLVRCKELIEQNGDTFIAFSKGPSSRYVDVHYICHEDGSQGSVSVVGCKRHIKSRNRFFEELRKNGDENITPYIKNMDSIWIKFSCGHTPKDPTTPNKYICGRGCPICAKRVIIPNTNDFYHEYEDLLGLFRYPQQTLGVPSSNDKIYFELVCQNCGIGHKKMTLANLCRNGFSCPYCSNRSSYFNRFMNKLLVELNADFRCEVRFDWCQFLSSDRTRFCHGIYDFVVDDKNLIIEMDGGFHDRPAVRYTDQEKDRLAVEHGYTILRIDCRYNNKRERFSRLINNLEGSDFVKYYSLQGIDLEKINAFALSNEYNIIIDLWNKGYSSRYIQKKVDLTGHTVASYLVEGNDRMDCVYSQSQARERSKDTRLIASSCGKTVGCFYSAQDAKRTLRSLLGVSFDVGMIHRSCKTNRSYHSLLFVNVESEDLFVSELEKDPLLNIISTDEGPLSCNKKLMELKNLVLQSDDFKSIAFDETGEKYSGTSKTDRELIRSKAKEDSISLWNRGFSMAYIVSKTRAHNSTIRRYLTQGKEEGKCNYDKYEAKRRGFGTHVKVLFQKRIIAAYVSIPEAVDNLNKIFDKHYSVAEMAFHVRDNICLGQDLFISEFQNEEEYVQATEKPCLLNDMYRGVKINRKGMKLISTIKNLLDNRSV